MVTINFESTYDLIEVSPDFSEATFKSIDCIGSIVLIKIQIRPLNNPLLPNVYNLSFGPPLIDGTVDDKIKIHHQDRNKVFSTILLFCLAFLQENPAVTIGLDGSNDVRAYLYHRMFISNRTYLDDFFVALGVDWHVRLLRDNSIETDVDGSPFFKPRYYMFHLTSKKI